MAMMMTGMMATTAASTGRLTMTSQAAALRHTTAHIVRLEVQSFTRCTDSGLALGRDARLKTHINSVEPTVQSMATTATARCAVFMRAVR